MKRIGCLLALLALAKMPAFAQSIFGSLQGTVTDASGGVLAKSRVTATNVNTGIRSAVDTNDAGLYFLGELRPGAYDLEVEAVGFQRFAQRGITLRVEDRLRVDVAMKVGQMTESVEVRAEAQLIQTESNTLGRVIDENTIKQLPLRGRNAFELVLLTPGAQQRGDDELPRRICLPG